MRKKMGRDWKENLSEFFEELRIIEESKKETIVKFEQFCEFIAEPAFESLEKELSEYRVTSKIKKSKGKWIAFQVNFKNSGIERFEYIISLPKNALELKLKLRIVGKNTGNKKRAEHEEQFMEARRTSDLLKLNKEDLIHDVIEHYRDIIFKMQTQPE